MDDALDRKAKASHKSGPWCFHMPEAPTGAKGGALGHSHTDRSTYDGGGEAFTFAVSPTTLAGHVRAIASPEARAQALVDSNALREAVEARIQTCAEGTATALERQDSTIYHV